MMSCGAFAAMSRWQRAPRLRTGANFLTLYDVSADTVEICRDPVGRRYRSARVATRGDQIAPLTFPDAPFAVTDLLG